MDQDGDKTAGVTRHGWEGWTWYGCVAGNTCMKVKVVGTGDMGLIPDKVRAIIADLGPAEFEWVGSGCWTLAEGCGFGEYGVDGVWRQRREFSCESWIG